MSAVCSTLPGMRITILVVVLVLSLPPAVLCQQRPLVTESVRTVGNDRLMFDIGIEFLQDAKFPFSGLEGDLTRVGVIGVRTGVGENVEIQLLGTAQNILNVENRFTAPNTSQLNFSGNSTSDIGNLTMATKVRLKEETAYIPALGFRFGAELPNTSNENGLGTDETNVFSGMLLEKQFGKLRVLANFGLEILGDPVSAGSQDDLLAYGVAFVYPAHDRFNLLVDTYGRTGSAGTGTEAQTLLRVGSQIKAAGMFWDVALFFGFRHTDPSSGLVIGVSRAFDFTLF